MPNVGIAKSFLSSRKRFTKNNAQREIAIKKAFKLFCENPKHPSLNTEKLSNSDIWSIRIDHGNRLFFTWNKTHDTAIFFAVGPHDMYKKL